MGKKVLYVVIALLVAMSVLSNCTRVVEKEVLVEKTTFIDGLGRAVTLAKTPERIISIAAAATETLYALGAQDKLVGRDDYSTYPPEAQDKPSVGTGASLNLEAVLGLEPDLVICWWFHTKAIEKLEEQGIPTVAINPQSIDGVLTTIKLLGTITGYTSEADALITKMKEEIAAVKDKVKDIPFEDRPLVYYEVKKKLGRTVGPGTFTDELIRTAGGINLAADRPERYPDLSSEYIIDKNPDVIVVISYGYSPEDIKARSGWDVITAVKSNRVYSIESQWVTASPSMIKGLKQFAHYFYPDLFPEVE